MPARIVIESGLRSGQDFPVERAMFHIGRDSATCHLCLPDSDVPDQAATVNYDSGQYRIYPRGASILLLDGQPLPRSGDTWRPGKRLQLGKQVVLRLLIEGSAAPVPRDPSIVAPPPIEPPKKTETPSKKPEAGPEKARQKQQLTAIAILGMIIALLLAVLFLGGPEIEDRAAVRKEAMELFKDLREQAIPEEGPNALWVVLQTAWGEEVRNPAAARKRYGEVLLRLQNRSPGSSQPSELDRRVEQFVSRRLKSLTQ